MVVAEVQSRTRDAVNSAVRVFPNVDFFGVSCWIAWVLLVYTGEFFAPFSGGAHGSQHAVTVMFAVSTTCLSLGMIVIGWRHRKTFALLHRFRWVLLAGAVASGGTAAALFGHLAAPAEASLVIGGALTGFGTSVIAMRAAARFAQLDSRSCLMTSAAVLVVAFLIYSCCLLLVGGLVATVFLICLPLIAAVFSFIRSSEDDSAIVDDGSAIPPRFFFRFIAGIALITMAFSFVRGYFPSGLRVDEFASSRNLTTWVCLAVSSGFVVVGAFLKNDRSVGSLCYWTILSIAFVFTIAPVLRLSTFLLGTLTGAANAFITMTAWVLLASIASKSGSSSLRVMGYGSAAVFLGTTFGWVAGACLFEWLDETALSICNGVMVVAVLLIASLLFNQRDFAAMTAPVDAECDESEASFGDGEPAGSKDNRRGEGASEQEGAVVAGRSRWRAVMRELAEEKGCSSRETEVFLLMAKGLDPQSIADELFISYNTVRTHVRNIYAKCDVHSRHEFVSMTKDAYAAADSPNAE